jgi:hypothetical protein
MSLLFLFLFKEYELRRKNLQYQSTILRKRTQKLVTAIFYNIKEFVQPKMSLYKREFLIWKERGKGPGGAVERERGGQAGIFKVRLGLGDIDR